MQNDYRTAMGAKHLRIALIAPLWAKIPPDSYGGIELTVNLLLEELLNRGHEVTLFASGDCKTRARLHPVCEENLLALMSDGRAFCSEYYINAAVAEAIRAAGDFDVLHFHTGASSVPFAVTSPRPSVFTLHTSVIVDDLWVAARYPQVSLVGVSRSQVETIRPAPEVIYNGCDFDAFTPGFERGRYFAFLGRMSDPKNPLGAIELARAAGMPLILAGEPQNAIERAYFEEKIMPQVDGKDVCYIGPVDHPAKNALLRDAAALLFPIRWSEPFGLVMIEAMACGTPVLGTRLGAVSEVVDQGVTGFSADRFEDLAGMIPDLLALDRRRVREQARQRFHFQTMVDGYERLYRKLAGLCQL